MCDLKLVINVPADAIVTDTTWPFGDTVMTVQRMEYFGYFFAGQITSSNFLVSSHVAS